MLLIVAGCSTQTTKPAKTAPAATHTQHLQAIAQVNAYTLKGRIGVNSNGKGFSGGIEWSHQNGQDNIDILSPFGSKVANISKNVQGVTLTTQDGHSISAQDAETLTQMTLGWRLPLNGLSDWVLGRPSNAQVDNAVWDENGRLTSLTQEGWQIEYQAYNSALTPALPSKLLLKSEKVNLKLMIEVWNSKPKI